MDEDTELAAWAEQESCERRRIDDEWMERAERLDKDLKELRRATIHIRHRDIGRAKKSAIDQRDRLCDEHPPNSSEGGIGKT